MTLQSLLRCRCVPRAVLIGLTLVTALSCYQRCLFVLAMAGPTVASKVRHAIELTNKANVDPSFGDESCRLWTEILSKHTSADDDEYKLPLPLGAMSASHGLFASTLVRMGKDKMAVVEYTNALNYLKEDGALSRPMTEEEFDIRVGMGRSLQRLLRYREASEVFIDVNARCENIIVAGEPNNEMNWIHLANVISIKSAALCFMRCGNLNLAISVLEAYNGKDAEINAMNGALILIELSSAISVLHNADERFERAMQLLRGATASSISCLYRWILMTSQINKPSLQPLELLSCDHLTLAEANNSMLDDPGLTNLDDKVLLHSILTRSRFWPQGFILPDDYALFLAEQSTNDGPLIEGKKWILKERSGYGSHGNIVMSTNDLLSMFQDGRLVEAILCQRIVNPPMLIDCRKFTIRVYVIYFPGSKITSSHGEESKDADVYISTEGLVKYALSQYDGDAEDISTTDLNEQYMTNSGRGDGRSTLQHDLHELQRIFQEKDMDYQTMWEIIEESVQEVMKEYVQLHRDGSLDHLRASIPKILGFDYILNSSGEPFLLEVNRFPGLEPRSSMDADVKHKVVYDAWITACDRMEIPQTFVQNVRPSTYKRCSLKKLSLAL